MKKWMERVRLKSSGDNNFHQCMRFTLIIGQAFALMPVSGIASDKVDSLRYRLASFRAMYSIVIILCLFVPMYACIYDVITHEASIDRITAAVFFTNAICVHIFFMDLAKHWPKLMKKWCNTELCMVSYGYPKNLNWRLKIMTLTMLTIATVEHLLSVINHLIQADQLKRDSHDIFEHFFVTIAFPQVFAIAQYSIWFGLFLQVVTFVVTFSWTFIDLFIMLMSCGLGLRFQQISDRVDRYYKDNVISENLWRNLREDYGRLVRLCKALNDSISSLVLLSFTSNVFFILVQLFHSIKKIEETVGKVYFWGSFGFLLGRTICVCLYGAWIYDESRRPLLTLNTLPSDVYNVEVKRFTMQVCFDTTALTGKNFFVVTRGLILSIAGAIMTYELVLIQYFATVQLQHNSTAN